MKVWVLAENTACRDGVRAEHGLSLYIEAGNRKILFDMGQSDAFLHNAGKLGIDLRRVDLAVLSHGHYDHGGGLAEFVRINPIAEIYVNQYAFEPHYNARNAYIGLDPQLQCSGRITWVDAPVALGDGIGLYPSGVLSGGPSDAGGLQVMTESGLVKDDFRHEQYLLITQGDRRVLFSGCSHVGVGRLLRHFCPDVLVGGFHLMKHAPDSAAVEQMGRSLLACPAQYYTCHCTGLEQYAALKTELGDRLAYLSGGAVLTI